MKTMIQTQTKKNQKESKVFTTKSITVIGMLSALAFGLMYFEIPLWFAPYFYKIDFSEVPVLIGAFALGPIAGIMIELLKNIIFMLIKGSGTAGIGELANFLIGCSLVVPCAFIYKYKKTKKSALIGLIVGTVSMVVIGSFLNAYFLLPFYAKNFMPMEAIINSGTEVNSSINSLSTFILYAVVPFNLLKGVVVSVISILLYKRLSVIIKTITK